MYRSKILPDIWSRDLVAIYSCGSELYCRRFVHSSCLLRDGKNHPEVDLQCITIKPQTFYWYYSYYSQLYLVLERLISEFHKPLEISMSTCILHRYCTVYVFIRLAHKTQRVYPLSATRLGFLTQLALEHFHLRMKPWVTSPCLADKVSTMCISIQVQGYTRRMRRSIFL
jgi:hypothetical protein